MMKVTYLGQQSWAVESGCDFVLIDPVLPDWFGTTTRLRFQIWPPRQVMVEKMPELSAVVITNEHLDHFNLRSLLMLPKHTKVYMGNMMMSCCVEAAERAGMSVTLLADKQPVVLSDLHIRLYLCAPESASWEKRVYHAVIESESSQQSVLIQSDGIISPDLVAGLAAGEINPVSLFIATNNAQIVPAGASGTYDNLLPIGKSENEGPFGLRVFHEILCRVTDELGYLPHLAFCGGGYLQSPSKHGPFLLSDADQLKQSFSALALGQKVHCPHPGDTYALHKSLQGIHIETEHAPWIVRNECLFTADVVNPDWFSNSIFPSFATNEDRAKAIRDIEQELKMMAPNLLCSDFGRCVTACNAYINGPTMPYRFAIRFYEVQTGHIMTAILGINNCRFDWKDTEEDAVIQHIPFGIDVHLVDFYELLQGGLQIWELATAKMRQWYVGEDKMRSPVAFLYSYFSEQVRPDLAANMYARIAMDETMEA